MFTSIPTLIIFLPGAILSLPLEGLFSSEELIEMGVYIDDLESIPATPGDHVNSSPSGPLFTCAGFSA
jgi:hypothetical protein